MNHDPNRYTSDFFNSLLKQCHSLGIVLIIVRRGPPRFVSGKEFGILLGARLKIASNGREWMLMDRYRHVAADKVYIALYIRWLADLIPAHVDHLDNCKIENCANDIAASAQRSW